MNDTPPDALAELLARAQAGERRAIGRLLSIVERGGGPADALATQALAHTDRAGHSDHAGQAHVIGITGAPGAGKSTLTGVLAAALAAAGRRVAVVAIDPSSPVTGGAILGDRIRMDDVVAPAHDNVFIRSMATRGQHGGLALAVPGALRVLDAAGFDVIAVETAGVGQVEIDIVAEADTTVVVCNPGWGDAIQAGKAGVLEVADVFVVNKADRPGTDDTVRDLEHMLDLGHPGPGHLRSGHDASGHDAPAWRPPVVCAVATEGRGVEALLDAIRAHHDDMQRSGELARRRAERLTNEVRRRARHAFDAAFEAALERARREDPTLDDALRTRAGSPAEITRDLLARLLREPPV